MRSWATNGGCPGTAGAGRLLTVAKRHSDGSLFNRLTGKSVGWHPLLMSWDPAKPWTAPVTSLVMYRDGSRWRFALNSESGIIDGSLIDLDEGATLDVAQDALIREVEDTNRICYTATCVRDL
jgi:hypothetical protein